jgi:hypothetical protein
MCDMKRKIFTTVLSTAILFAACTKDDVGYDDMTASVNASGGGDGSGPSTGSSTAFASSWESSASWSAADSSNFRIFTFNRSLPNVTSDVLANGVVMVWAKNLPMDPSFTNADKPMMMPFYLFPDNERPKYVEYYYYSANNGNITVKYRTNNQEMINGNGSPSHKIEYRYFVITPDVLAKKGVTQSQVSQMNYQQLVTAFGVSE